MFVVLPRVSVIASNISILRGCNSSLIIFTVVLPLFLVMVTLYIIYTLHFLLYHCCTSWGFDVCICACCHLHATSFTSSLYCYILCDCTYFWPRVYFLVDLLCKASLHLIDNVHCVCLHVCTSVVFTVVLPYCFTLTSVIYRVV